MQVGTTFHFVTGGIDGAPERARAAAGDQNVAIAGGAATVNQFLNAGLIDELRLHITPVLLGRGERLFERRPNRACATRRTAHQAGHPRALRRPATRLLGATQGLITGHQHSAAATGEADMEHDMANLTGKTALVTGASRGIGRAIAQRLAADSAPAYLCRPLRRPGALMAGGKLCQRGEVSVQAAPTPPRMWPPPNASSSCCSGRSRR